MLKQIQRLPFAPIVALMFAAVAAVLILATPVWLLEHAVVQLGVPDIVSSATPPLGNKARFLLAILAAGGAGAVAFLAAFPFRDPKPRTAHVVTVQPLHRAEPDAAAFNRPSVFTPPPLDDEPNLPSFLAEPLAQMSAAESPQNESSQGDVLPLDTVSLTALAEAGNDEDELMLDELMIVEDDETWDDASLAEVEAGFRAAIRNAVEDVPVVMTHLPQMPDIFTQPDSVLHLEPAPVPPPPDPVLADPILADPAEIEPVLEERRAAPRPRIVEQREPTIAELMERFQRGLETLKQLETSPLDDPALRNALTQLERIAVGGR